MEKLISTILDGSPLQYSKPILCPLDHQTVDTNIPVNPWYFSLSWIAENSLNWTVFPRVYAPGYSWPLARLARVVLMLLVAQFHPERSYSHDFLNSVTGWWWFISNSSFAAQTTVLTLSTSLTSDTVLSLPYNANKIRYSLEYRSLSATIAPCQTIETIKWASLFCYHSLRNGNAVLWWRYDTIEPELFNVNVTHI